LGEFRGLALSENHAVKLRRIGQRPRALSFPDTGMPVDRARQEPDRDIRLSLPGPFQFTAAAWHHPYCANRGRPGIEAFGPGVRGLGPNTH